MAIDLKDAILTGAVRLINGTLSALAGTTVDLRAATVQLPDGVAGVAEAPEDGVIRGRKDGAWVPIPSGGGSGGGGGTAGAVVYAQKTDVWSAACSGVQWQDVPGLSVDVDTTAGQAVEIAASVFVGASPSDRLTFIRIVRGDGTMVAPPTGDSGGHILSHDGTYNGADAVLVYGRLSALVYDTAPATGTTTYKVQATTDGRSGTVTVNQTGRDTGDVSYTSRTTSALRVQLLS